MSVRKVKSITVVIATVPWRIPAVLRLFRSVCAQSVMPARVDFILDGHTPEERQSLYEAVLDISGLPLVHFVTTPEGMTGNCFRWHHIATDVLTDYTAILDDDLTVGFDYLEKSLRVFEQNPLADVIAWSGFPPGGGVLFLHADAEKDYALGQIHAGACMMKTAVVRGFQHMPNVKGFNWYKDHDEAFMSYWFWTMKNTMIRPKGPIDVTNQPEQNDPRSGGKTNAPKWAWQHNELMKLGWPGMFGIQDLGYRP